MTENPDQDVSYQYVDGLHLLHAVLLERDQLLSNLEHLVKAAQTKSGNQIINFDTSRAQTLLYELTIVAEKIDSLILQINDYAERAGLPPVKIIEPNSPSPRAF